MMTGVTIFIQLLLCYHAAGAVTDAEQRILNELAEKFLSSDSDFMEIKKNADFFPFVYAVEQSDDGRPMALKRLLAADAEKRKQTVQECSVSHKIWITLGSTSSGVVTEFWNNFLISLS